MHPAMLEMLKVFKENCDTYYLHHIHLTLNECVSSADLTPEQRNLYNKCSVLDLPTDKDGQMYRQTLTSIKVKSVQEFLKQMRPFDNLPIVGYKLEGVVFDGVDPKNKPNFCYYEYHNQEFLQTLPDSLKDTILWSYNVRKREVAAALRTRVPLPNGPKKVEVCYYEQWVNGNNVETKWKQLDTLTAWRIVKMKFNVQRAIKCEQH